MCRAAPGCPISDHHRVITYVRCRSHAHRKLDRAHDPWGGQDLLGVKMVVHFEVDACLPTEAPGTMLAAEMSPSPVVDNLADALRNITLSSAASSSSSPATIHVLRAGTHIPQDALLELASRKASSVKYLDWNASTHNSRSHRFRHCVSACTSTAYSRSCTNGKSSTLVRVLVQVRQISLRSGARPPRSSCDLRMCWRKYRSLRFRAGLGPRGASVSCAKMESCMFMGVLARGAACHRT